MHKDPKAFDKLLVILDDFLANPDIAILLTEDETDKRDVWDSFRRHLNDLGVRRRHISKYAADFKNEIALARYVACLKYRVLQ